jgi:hypothetical protein
LKDVSPRARAGIAACRQPVPESEIAFFLPTGGSYRLDRIFQLSTFNFQLHASGLAASPDCSIRRLIAADFLCL